MMEFLYRLLMLILGVVVGWDVIDRMWRGQPLNRAEIFLLTVLLVSMVLDDVHRFFVALIRIL